MRNLKILSLDFSADNDEKSNNIDEFNNVCVFPKGLTFNFVSLFLKMDNYYLCKNWGKSFAEFLSKTHNLRFLSLSFEQCDVSYFSLA